MADGPHIRPYRPEDEPQLGALFKACFGVDVGPAYFDWKYHQNPAGEMIGSVAEAGDRIGGFYGVIPEPWTVGGADATIYQGMDSMVHPDFRRRGLYLKVAGSAHDEIRRRTDRCDLVGVAGSNSLPAALQKSWIIVREFRPLVLPAALVRLGPRGRSAAVTVEPISGPDGRVHHVLANARGTVQTAKPRLEGEFFDWRVFGASPKRLRAALVCRHGEPLAVGVYAVTTRRATMVSYVAALPDVDGREWFGSLVRFAARAGGSALYTWEPGQWWLASLYRKLGFRPNPLARGPLSQRWPLVVRSDTGFVNGVRWDLSTGFDVQPLMQD